MYALFPPTLQRFVHWRVLYRIWDCPPAPLSTRQCHLQTDKLVYTPLVLFRWHLNRPNEFIRDYEGQKFRRFTLSLYFEPIFWKASQRMITIEKPYFCLAQFYILFTLDGIEKNWWLESWCHSAVRINHLLLTVQDRWDNKTVDKSQSPTLSLGIIYATTVATGPWW